MKNELVKLKPLSISNLWIYKKSITYKLILSGILIIVAIVLSEFNYHLVSIGGMLISSLIFLYSFLRIPKEFGVFRGVISYMFIISAFIYCFSNIYTEFGILKGDILIKDISTSIYFSMVTWTTLGYGDFQPTEGLRIWASTEAFLGYVFTGILVGIIMYGLTDDK